MYMNMYMYIYIYVRLLIYTKLVTILSIFFYHSTHLPAVLSCGPMQEQDSTWGLWWETGVNRTNLLVEDARPANAFMLRRFFGADNF